MKKKHLKFPAATGAMRTRPLSSTSVAELVSTSARDVHTSLAFLHVHLALGALLPSLLLRELLHYIIRFASLLRIQLLELLAREIRVPGDPTLPTEPPLALDASYFLNHTP